MAKREKRQRTKARQARAKREAGGANRFDRLYQHACCAAEKRQHREAKRLYEDVLPIAPDARREALVRNDLAALAALAGATDEARAGFERALALDKDCGPARTNLAMLNESIEMPSNSQPLTVPSSPDPRKEGDTHESATRVAIVSFVL